MEIKFGQLVIELKGHLKKLEILIPFHFIVTQNFLVSLTNHRFSYHNDATPKLTWFRWYCSKFCYVICNIPTLELFRGHGLVSPA